MNEVMREFLLETHENLSQLDLDLVTLEREPTESKTLARVFRTIHTVKGTAGFLGFAKLQGVSHSGESLLGLLRSGEAVFNAEIASALLALVDAIRRMLASIEATGGEGDGDYSELIGHLDRLKSGGPAPAPAPAAPAPIVPGPPAAGPPPPPPIAPTPDAATEQASVAGPVAPAPSPIEMASEPPAPPTIVVAGPEPAPAEPPETRAPAVSDSAIRVDVKLLDKLMTLVGELVLARNQIVQFSSSQENAAFLGTVQRLNLLTTELQANVMKTRMQPIGNIWNKFPRVVRDIAVACEKQVRIDLEGQETELDKTIIEAIRDPLTHILRNAVDHGIETPAERVARGKPAEGRLSLSAFHEGGKVIIEIVDDGRGIDPQRVRDKAVKSKFLTADQAGRLTDADLVNLLFLPGFSTAEQITHFSGRGVGMDVVRTNVEKIGGSVDLESRVGRGTTLKMKIPLTLAIIPALTITDAGDRYAIPQVSLLELVRLDRDQSQQGIEWIHDIPVYRLRGNLLPLVYLHKELRNEAGRAENGEINIVVLQADDRQFGLIVDAIHDTEEIVVKPLQKQLKGIGVFSGATIMGDGKVALILDVLGLAQRSNVISGVRDRILAEKAEATTSAAGIRKTLLLFATRDGGRMALPLSQVARLEEFPRSVVERVGNQRVVQYRGEILPLVDVSKALRQMGLAGAKVASSPARTRRGQPKELAETVPVVVHSAEGRLVGLVVGQILDIVDEAIESESRASRPGVLFRAVIQGRVTEFLDVRTVIDWAESSSRTAPELAERGA